MFTQFNEYLYSQIGKLPFDKLVIFVWGSYALLFFITLILSFWSDRIRGLSKRPFLCLTNAYAGVTLALFLMKMQLSQSVFMTVIFWIAGYLCYGILCVLRPKKAVAHAPSAIPQVAIEAVPSAPAPKARADVPVAKNNVRLEHAVQVTEKLLTKNLGKGDRQELEKLKNTLAVLQIKGTLSTAEADILNENFNTLLKLMAKYNV